MQRMKVRENHCPSVPIQLLYHLSELVGHALLYHESADWSKLGSGYGDIHKRRGNWFDDSAVWTLVKTNQYRVFSQQYAGCLPSLLQLTIFNIPFL